MVNRGEPLPRGPVLSRPAGTPANSNGITCIAQQRHNPIDRARERDVAGVPAHGLLESNFADDLRQRLGQHIRRRACPPLVCAHTHTRRSPSSCTVSVACIHAKAFGKADGRLGGFPVLHRRRLWRPGLSPSRRAVAGWGDILHQRRPRGAAWQTSWISPCSMRFALQRLDQILPATAPAHVGTLSAGSSSMPSSMSRMREVRRCGGSEGVVFLLGSSLLCSSAFCTQPRKPQHLALGHVFDCHFAGQVAHAAHGARAFGYADGAARIQQVKHVAMLATRNRDAGNTRPRSRVRLHSLSYTRRTTRAALPHRRG